jgi:serine/threonine-protein kinase
LNAQINENPVPLIEVNPDLPVELNDIVLKAMAKDPAARFQNADAMRNALRGLRGAQAAAVPVSTPVAAASATAAAGAVPSATAAVSAVPDLASSASAVNEAPKFTPVPQVAPVAQKSKSNRGLWIVLGAVAAVLAIVAVATLVPRFYPMFAKHSSASSTTAQSDAAATPAVPASSQPADTASTASQSATLPVANAPSANANPAASVPANSNPPAKTARPPYVPQSANASPAALTNAPPVPAGPDPAQIREVKDKLMNLSARADGVRSGVQALRSQQQAQGLDLRTDIVASLSRMNNDLAEAQQSLNERDLNGANEYIDRADREVAKLEAFLGH